MNRRTSLALPVVLFGALWPFPQWPAGRDTPISALLRPLAPSGRSTSPAAGSTSSSSRRRSCRPPWQGSTSTWTIDHTAGTSTEVLIERHKDTDWAKEFDVVLYNMSFSFVVDVPWIERLVAAHRDSGVGAVILHGAVHSYRRSETRAWGELMGAFSLRHDAQRPLTVETVAPPSDHARRAADVGDDPRRAVRARTRLAEHDAARPGLQHRDEEDATRSSGRTRTARPGCSSRHWATTPR